MKQQAGNIKGSVWDQVDKRFGEETVPMKKNAVDDREVDQVLIPLGKARPCIRFIGCAGQVCQQVQASQGCFDDCSAQSESNGCQESGGCDEFRKSGMTGGARSEEVTISCSQWTPIRGGTGDPLKLPCPRSSARSSTDMPYSDKNYQASGMVN